MTAIEIHRSLHPTEACVKRRPTSHTRKSLMSRAVIPLLLCLTVPAAVAQAAQWHRLTRTAHYTVAVEMDSLPQNSSATLSVLLQFTPHGEPQRRLAADRYGYRNYALHLERHEIDCTGKSARLEYVDILGWRGNRIARIPGGNRRDAIVPDSVLDRVVDLVCPDDRDNDGENATEEEAATALPLSQAALQLINDAQRRTASEPDNFDAWVELGNAWYDADMPRQAIEAYDHALTLKPDDSDVLNDQGAMYRQNGDTQRALANFEKALATNPDNLESLYNLGYIYAFDLNRMDRAREFWQRYLEKDGSSETAGQVRSFLRQQGENAGKR